MSSIIIINIYSLNQFFFTKSQFNCNSFLKKVLNNKLRRTIFDYTSGLKLPIRDAGQLIFV